MEQRNLGKTGLKVTTLGFGAMEVRGPRVWGGRPVTDQQADRILNAVLDAGINFIDTSYDYGRSEEFIGKSISKRRGEYYIATKCGCSFVDKGDHDDTPHVWTRENLLHNIDHSLSLMKTDHVDVWQLHNPSVEQVEQGDLVRVMEEVQRSGKVRWIGISSTLPHINTYIDWEKFATFQIPYSALERQHEDVINTASNSGAGIIIRGGVARGAPEEEGLGNKDRWATWNKAKLDELLSPGETHTSFMLRYTLSHPNMHTTIVGTLIPEHLQENLRAASAGPLPKDVYNEAKHRLDAVGEKPASS
jgi:aryl-alcohol dehydrogenase-like predicted oxidoreductase